MSAFVEDSVLLGGIDRLLLKLSQLLGDAKNGVKFGGQFTTDLLLSKTKHDILRKLMAANFSYVFWGIETGNEMIASRMSKNVHTGSWIKRNEEVISFLNSAGIDGGVSILFGLGESHEDRIKILDQLKAWKDSYGIPNVISLNWAVQHPLRGVADGLNYNYLEWGTPQDSPYLDVFTELFGEASINYPMKGSKLASVEQYFRTVATDSAKHP